MNTGFGKNTGMGETQMSMAGGLSADGKAASLKGKLQGLEELIRTISEEINYHKKEVHNLRAEKVTLEEVLTMKAQDVRRSLATDVTRVEEELKRSFATQKSENTRLQQQITALKQEKTILQ